MKEQNLYPLDDCNNCLHNGVCKFIGQFNEFKASGLPVDFESLACIAYMENDDCPLDPEGTCDGECAKCTRASVTDEMVDGKIVTKINPKELTPAVKVLVHIPAFTSDILGQLAIAVENIVEQGYKPTEIHMSEKTMKAIIDASGVAMANIAEIETESGTNVKVIVDNSLKLTQVVFMCLLTGGDDSGKGKEQLN